MAHGQEHKFWMVFLLFNVRGVTFLKEGFEDFGWFHHRGKALGGLDGVRHYGGSEVDPEWVNWLIVVWFELGHLCAEVRRFLKQTDVLNILILLSFITLQTADRVKRRLIVQRPQIQSTIEVFHLVRRGFPLLEPLLVFTIVSFATSVFLKFTRCCGHTDPFLGFPWWQNAPLNLSL